MVLLRFEAGMQGPTALHYKMQPRIIEDVSWAAREPAIGKWQLTKPIAPGSLLCACCAANIENCASLMAAITCLAMGKDTLGLPAILDKLEAHYGPQQVTWPTEPYDFLVWWHCGYPASDTACAKGWKSLTASVGIEPKQLLAASIDILSSALKPGGMVPELRALRLKEIAARVQDEYGCDLRFALTGPLESIRKTLKKFPNIADPGADRILLFSGIAPTAAVPSNCPHVLARIIHGLERENYGVTYREAQEAIENETAPKTDVRLRAYLLVKHHGQTLCKRTKPKCDQCPISANCAYYAGKRRGRSVSA
jgi:endonuclease-3